MRDQINLVQRSSVNVAKKLNTLFGHRYDTGRELNDFLKRALMFGRGVAQNRMQGGDYRHPEVS